MVLKSLSLGFYATFLGPKTGGGSIEPFWGDRSNSGYRFKLEEDKRATTNVQNGLVFFFLFSFGLFSSHLS